MASPDAAASKAVPSASSMVDLLHLLHNLKKTPRTGWVRSGVKEPESIADHMYRMAVLALLLTGSEYDSNRLVKMAIVHDIAEAIVGDIAPSDNVPAADKHAREAAAVKTIQDMLGSETAAAKEIGTLWWEYEKGETPEAQVCKDFDKIEMILQASEYEQEQSMTLQDFFDSTAGKWKTEYGYDFPLR